MSDLTTDLWLKFEEMQDWRSISESADDGLRWPALDHITCVTLVSTGESDEVRVEFDFGPVKVEAETALAMQVMDVLVYKLLLLPPTLDAAEEFMFRTVGGRGCVIKFCAPFIKQDVIIRFRSFELLCGIGRLFVNVV